MFASRSTLRRKPAKRPLRRQARIETLEDRVVMDYASAVSASNPLAYWRFNETSGTTATNIGTLGAAANGTYTNGPTLNQNSVFSNFGRAVSFDGGDDFVSTIAAPTLGMNGSWTAMAWIKPTALGGDKSIFGTETGGTNIGLHLVVRGNEVYEGFYANDSGAGAEDQITTNDWYHVAWRYNQAAGEQAIFINGELVSGDQGHANFQGTTTVNIGRSLGGAIFAGLIDEVSINGSALTTAQIQAIYNSAFTADAVNDSLPGVPEDSGVIPIPAPGVLANDTGAGVTVTTVNTGSTVGLATINPDGSGSYNPNGQFNSLAQGQFGADTVTYGVVGFGPVGATPYVLGNFGPGGNLTAYLMQNDNMRWDEARYNARNTTFAGATGNLVAIGTAAENTFVQTRIAPYIGNPWIGLTDSNSTSTYDGVTLTGVEAGTNPNGGWKWVNGESFAYQNFFPGEPNDSGGEDAVQLRGDSTWNDAQAGESLGQGGAQGASIWEYNLGVNSVANLRIPGLITTVYQGTIGLGNLAQADSVISTPANRSFFVDTVTGVVNMNNNNNGDDTGFFFRDSFVPGLPNDASNYVLESKGFVWIPAAGNYTFAVNSDDGFRITMPGASFVSGVNLLGSGPTFNTVGGNSFGYDGGRGAGTPTYGTMSFPTAGFYQFTDVNWEGGGGASLEIFASAGTQTTFGPTFHLLGDVQSGGLGTYTNLPTGAQDTATVSIQIVGANDPPVAVNNVIAPIQEGQSASFSAVGSSDVDNGTVLTYSWDINGDNVFGDATGVSPTLTWAQLQALSPPVNQGGNPATNFTVTVRVSDGITTTTSATRTLTVSNKVPTASVSGDAIGAPNQTLSYDFFAVDSSNAGVGNDQAAGFVFNINFGDAGNTADDGATPAGTASGYNRTHAFSAPGSYTVTVTATDQNGGVSVVATQNVFITSVVQVGTDLIAGGSGLSDNILFSKAGGGITVRVNGKTSGPFFGVERIVAFGGGSSDTISAGNSNMPASFVGGDGNDKLTGGTQDDELDGGDGNDTVSGNNGNDTILGDDGNDVLNGGQGNDTMSGGEDNDKLNGNQGDDFLYGDAGNDSMTGDVGRDVMHGGDGIDTLNGGNSDDVLLGDADNDRLLGGAGNDVLIGGTGADKLEGQNGNDLMIAGESAVDTDTDDNLLLYLTDWSDSFDTSAFEPVSSDGDTDTLIGGSGTDFFFGDTFQDRLQDVKEGSGDMVF